MPLTRWQPVPSGLFTSLFDTPTAGLPARRFAAPTDIVESDTHYILRADLPGVSEDDINVELDGNVLSISGERRSQSGIREGGYHRYERTSGSFRRSVRLPEGVDAEAIEAAFDRGVLEVTVPKPVVAAPHKIAVSVGAAPRALKPTDIPASAESDAVVETEARSSNAEPLAA